MVAEFKVNELDITKKYIFHCHDMDIENINILKEKLVKVIGMKKSNILIICGDMDIYEVKNG